MNSGAEAGTDFINVKTFEPVAIGEFASPNEVLTLFMIIGNGDFGVNGTS